METECNSINNSDVYSNLLQKVVFKLFPDDLFKCEHDCSLGGLTNAECISQLMTKEFIRNHYKDFKTMWDEYFPAFMITTQNQTCGMHVNVSNGCFGTNDKMIEESVRKFFFFVNYNYDFCKVLFNRTNSTMYCARRSSDMNVAKNEDIFRDTSHGNCLNYSHYRQGRIEIRLVGGQKNFACFRNTMESVFFLVENMRNLKWDDLTDLSKVFAGCNSYVFDRLTRCHNEGKISSANIEAIRETVKEVTYL